MSLIPKASHTLRTASRRAALSVAVIVLTWCIVIGWWQSTQRVVTTGDTLVYLIALPLTLLLCLFATSRLLSANKRLRRAPSDQSPEPSPVALINERPGTVSHAALPILATWAATYPEPDQEHGIGGHMEQRSRPKPDQFLTDANGFPVLSGRVRDLDTENIENDLRQILAIGESHSVEENWRDAFTRALALLDSVLNQILRDWPLTGSLLENDRTAPEVTPILRGSVGLPANTKASPQLRVVLLVPGDFSAPEQRLAEKFLAARLATLQHHGDRAFNVIPTADDASALAIADEFRRTSLHDAVPHALLLLACDSRLCPTVIEDLADQQRLFDPRRSEGLIVGEAAFGTLFSNTRTLRLTGTQASCALTPVFRTQREYSADAPARLSCHALERTVEEALEASGIPPERIGAVACDADHRANRTLESIATMVMYLPHLDAIRHRLATNEARGHLGAASVPGLLAMGATRCANASHPVLLFNVSHDRDRAAAVLIPAGASSAGTENSIQHVA